MAEDGIGEMLVSQTVHFTETAKNVFGRQF